MSLEDINAFKNVYGVEIHTRKQNMHWSKRYLSFMWRVSNNTQIF